MKIERGTYVSIFGIDKDCYEKIYNALLPSAEGDSYAEPCDYDLYVTQNEYNYLGITMTGYLIHYHQPVEYDNIGYDGRNTREISATELLTSQLLTSGLPAIGSKIMVNTPWPGNSNTYVGTVLAYDDEIVICRMGEDYPDMVYDGFHFNDVTPVPDERRETIDRMIDVIADRYNLSSTEGLEGYMETLYDAGLRFENLELKIEGLL